MTTSRTAAVIGGGPAGLMAAEALSAAGVPVTVYDRMPSVGRKFLMAGRGGLNLTHSEPLEGFLARYGAAQAKLQPLVEAFSPADLIAWAHGLGQETHVGSSGADLPHLAQGLATAARLAGAAASAGGGDPHAPRLAGLGRRRGPALQHAGGRGRGLA